MTDSRFPIGPWLTARSFAYAPLRGTLAVVRLDAAVADGIVWPAAPRLTVRLGAHSVRHAAIGSVARAAREARPAELLWRTTFVVDVDLLELDCAGFALTCPRLPSVALDAPERWEFERFYAELDTPRWQPASFMWRRAAALAAAISIVAPSALALGLGIGAAAGPASAATVTGTASSPAAGAVSAPSAPPAGTGATTVTGPTGGAGTTATTPAPVTPAVPAPPATTPTATSPTATSPAAAAASPPAATTTTAAAPAAPAAPATPATPATPAGAAAAPAPAAPAAATPAPATPAPPAAAAATPPAQPPSLPARTTRSSAAPAGSAAVRTGHPRRPFADTLHARSRFHARRRRHHHHHETAAHRRHGAHRAGRETITLLSSAPAFRPAQPRLPQPGVLAGVRPLAAGGWTHRPQFASARALAPSLRPAWPVSVGHLVLPRADRPGQPARRRPGGATGPAGAGGSGSAAGMPAIPADALLLSAISQTFTSADMPAPFLIALYKRAGRHYGIPWPVLAAINWTETDFGRNLSRSSAGAIGWMQFMPATWKQYGVAADPGPANPWDPADAIFSAARYLAANGGRSHIRQALFAYNHATWYVDLVLWRAELIAEHGVGPTSGVRPRITSMLAMADLLDGEPYVWGGGHGGWAISTGYDCSGFVSAVLHAGGLLRTPVTTQALPAQPGIAAGPGRYVTIFDRTDGGSADADHVIIYLNGQWWESGGMQGAGVHRLPAVSAEYLATFNRILHPRGM